MQAGLYVGVTPLPHSNSGDVTVKPTNHVASGQANIHAVMMGEDIGLRKSQRPSGLRRRDQEPTSRSPPGRGSTRLHHEMTTYLRRIVTEAQRSTRRRRRSAFSKVAVEDGSGACCLSRTRRASTSGYRRVERKVCGPADRRSGLGGTGTYVLDFVAKDAGRRDTTCSTGIICCSTTRSARQERRPLPSCGGSRRKSPTSRRCIRTCGAASSRTPMFLDETDADALSGLDFVFLCIDRAPAKRTIVRYLEAHRIPFIDVGMGVLRNEDGLLGGIVRVTTSTPETRQEDCTAYFFLRRRRRYQAYTKNIQIADLNALNASLATRREAAARRVLSGCTAGILLGVFDRQWPDRQRRGRQMRISRLQAEFVEFIPEHLHPACSISRVDTRQGASVLLRLRTGGRDASQPGEMAFLGTRRKGLVVPVDRELELLPLPVALLDRGGPRSGPAQCRLLLSLQSKREIARTQGYTRAGGPDAWLRFGKTSRTLCGRPTAAFGGGGRGENAALWSRNCRGAHVSTVATRSGGRPRFLRRVIVWGQAAELVARLAERLGGAWHIPAAGQTAAAGWRR